MRCNICDSDRFSPLAQVSYHGHVSPRLEFRKPGRFQNRPTFAAAFARACLDCGAIVYFVSQPELLRLAEVPDELGVTNYSRRYFDEETDAWIEEE
ncbi:hypothetical protein [Dactylosporangium sp. CA-139066]|uniref:hypothetical protein n=1 Tax=Dactylosporangium sp. CA-139066 TaxID=3239930 RepID=UPI003D8AD588